MKDKPLRAAWSLLLCVALVGFTFSPSDLQGAQATQTPQPDGAKDKQPAEKLASRSLKPPLAFGLEDGTPIRLRLSKGLSSADAATGNRVEFEVLEDVKVKNTMVIPRGSIAMATITEAKHKRRMGRAGKLSINLENVRLADGERAPLHAVKEARGSSHVGRMTMAMVGTGIAFFPVAPLFLFLSGRDISIPQGTEITAYIAGDIPLDPQKFELSQQ